MRILATIFGLLFLAGIAQFWYGISFGLAGHDGGRADAVLGVGLVLVALLGWVVQLAVHALDVWLRRRGRTKRS